LSAKKYITNFEEWVEKQISDPAIFPDNGERESLIRKKIAMLCVDSTDQIKTGQYNADFKERVQQILKKMARVYTHIYCHHLQRLQDIGAEKEMNSHFKRFYTFVKEHNLVDDQEFEPVYFVLWKLE